MSRDGESTDAWAGTPYRVASRTADEMFPMPNLADGAANAAWRTEFSRRMFNKKLARTDTAIHRYRAGLARADLRTAPQRVFSLIGVIALTALAVGGARPR